MRLKLIRPSRRRANALGTALGALGTAVGALPVTVRPKRSPGPSVLKIAAPVSLGALLIGVVTRRRRAAAEEQWSSPAGEANGGVAEPKTETEREKARETGEEASAAAEAGSEG